MKAADTLPCRKYTVAVCFVDPSRTATTIQHCQYPKVVEGWIEVNDNDGNHWSFNGNGVLGWSALLEEPE